VGHAKERSHAPGGGDAECYQKGESHDPSCSVVFAPALHPTTRKTGALRGPRLEHGDQSNREQDECGDGENLDPHDEFLVSGLGR